MKKLILMVAICLIVFSCKSENNPIIYFDENAELLPLEVGNKWEYEVIYNSKILNLVDTVKETVEIASFYDNDGITWYGIKASWFMYSIQENSVWGQHTQSPSKPVPNLLYKYPTFVGDTYPNFEVLSLNKVVKTDLGSFETIQYRFRVSSDIPEYEDIYICSGIGIVKRVWVKMDDNGNYYNAKERELISYKIK